MSLSRFDKIAVGSIIALIVAIIALMVWLGQNRLRVVSVFPADGASAVSTQTTLQITLAEPPVANERGFSFAINPPVVGGVRIVNSKIQFVPQNALQPQTDYTVAVRFENQSQAVATWHFTTAPLRLLYLAPDSEQHNQIFIADWQGDHPRQLTTEPLGVWSYAPSPQGEWLAYTGDWARGWYYWDNTQIDGAIYKLNVATKEVQRLTVPGQYVEDEERGREEISGTLMPVWSPDGNQIAYRNAHMIYEGYGTLLNEDELWVMNADGTGRRKLRDKWATCTWTPDSAALVVSTTDGVEIVEVRPE